MRERRADRRGAGTPGADGPAARRLRATPGLRARPDPAHRPGLPRRRVEPARPLRPARPRRRHRPRPPDAAQLAGAAADDGRSRDTIARRATAARVFTAWLHRTGRLPLDPGAALGSPKKLKTLPPVLRADEAEALIRSAAGLADDGTPVGVRGRGMLELLYATGIRVGELVGLDVDDVDDERRVVRVLGKGRKERSVPYGTPAARALDRWLTAAGRRCGGRGRVRRCSSASGVGASTSVPSGTSCTGGSPTSRARPTSARTACGTPRRPPARGRRGPALGAGAARARLARHHPALHPRHHRPPPPGLPAGPPAA